MPRKPQWDDIYTPEQKREYIRSEKRRCHLIDKEFEGTPLTTEEQAECEALMKARSAYVAPFYAPILAGLEERVKG